MRRILFFIVLLLTAATGARAESVTFYPAEVYEFYPLNTTFTTEKQGVWLRINLGGFANIYGIIRYTRRPLVELAGRIE